MNETEIGSVLQRGGMSLPHIARRYDPLLDPEGAETLGHLLADAVRKRGANAVIVWGDATDAILGFIVARRLGLPVVRLLDDDGLLDVHGAFPPSARAALVTDVARDDHVAAAIAAVTRNRGELVAVATLVAEGRLRAAVPVAALIQVDQPEGDDASDTR